MELKNKKILITGASGFVGARLFKDLSESHEVIGTYYKNKIFDELVHTDLTDPESVTTLIANHKPDVVVHCAAIASTKPCESDPELAHTVNVDSVRNIRDAIQDTDIKLIHLSTLAAINSANVYAKTKLEAENLLRDLSHVAILRLSVAFGISPNKNKDKVSNSILEKIQTHENAEYSSDWQFNMTYLGHLTNVVEQLLGRDDFPKEPIPVIASGATSIYNIASDLMSSYNIKVDEITGGKKQEPENVTMSLLSQNGLPMMSYDDVIEAFREEIREVM